MLIPHLHFRGTCKEAIDLYEKAFNTKVVSLIKDTGNAGEDLISHAVMFIHGQKVFLNDRFGNNENNTDVAVHLIVTFRTAYELRTVYKILGEGSTTIDPMVKLPYSELAVQFIDRFGVQWGLMVE